MKNLHKAASLFNVVFFTLSAVAAFYVVHEAWFYGFFLTPFPTVLTAVALIFGGAALMSWRVMCKGPQAAYETSVSFSPGVERAIRNMALLMPIPLICYGLLSYAVQHWHPGTKAMFDVSVAYVQCERFLFGTKRADERLSKLAGRYFSHGQNEMAEQYAELAVANIVQIPKIVFGSPDSYKRRLVERLDLLARIYEQQGKYGEALQTWQRRHIAIHEVHWNHKKMNWLCSSTMAKEAYNQLMLGHRRKADTLYRLAERVMPGDFSTATVESETVLTESSTATNKRCMPLFCNHLRLLLERMPSEYALYHFGERLNRYNPNVCEQQYTAANAFVTVTPENYERLVNGVIGSPALEAQQLDSEPQF